MKTGNGCDFNTLVANEQAIGSIYPACRFVENQGAEMHGLKDFADILGGFATAVAVIIAILALVLAKRQITAASEVSREAGALQAFREYLKLCFDEPEYSSTEMFLKRCPNLDLQAIKTALTPETERYLWFLSILLSSCEEISAFVSSRGKWRKILVLHVGFHAPAMRVVWPEWRKSYTEPVQAIVDEAIDGRFG